MRRKFSRRIRRVHRTKPLVTTQRKNVRLRYNDVNSTNFDATATIQFNLYYINSAYDMNAALATTNIVGYAEWITMYANYRVNMVVMKTRFANHGDTPVYCGQWARPRDDAAIAGWSDFLETTGNKYAKKQLLDNQYGTKSSTTITSIWPLAKLTGNPAQYRGEIAYSARTNAGPANIMHGYKWIGSYDGVTVSGPVAMMTEITVYLTFYNKRTMKD